MIILGRMDWSWVFSYGANNTIDFSVESLMQLVGKNGHGKSSIALILEEVLYNTNSKKIKKSAILNRNAPGGKYNIDLWFRKDADQYEIHTVRASTSTVKLIKNGEDISAHTATATYKLIEEIMGMDHKSFAQIVYQSSASSLEFLVATDSNRKKFLIDLLSLEVYSKYHEFFKEIAKTLDNEVSRKKGVVDMAKAWIDKLAKEDLTIAKILPLPSYDIESLQKKIFDAENTLKNIVAINKRIVQNNTYKKILSELSLPLPEDVLPIPPWTALIEERATLKAVVAATTPLITKYTNLSVHKCPTCSQSINTDEMAKLKAAEVEKKTTAEKRISEINLEISVLDKLKAKYDSGIAKQLEYEKYHALVDNTIESAVKVETDIQDEIKLHNETIRAWTKEIDSVKSANKIAEAKNNKIAVLLEQKDEMQDQLTVASEQLVKIEARAARISILVKAFSSTGVVAYKIESLVKDLEDLTNENLADLSDGRFTLGFNINASDKLNVVITDNGEEIDILALSGGELARVNMATLLAIRKLMQSLSESRINLLVLDETISSLDTEGKEKLIEVLLNEAELNTVIVSHDYTHPLLDKVIVEKIDNISRIVKE
jgi:DNA repair exonuclease SbcCD ATPase subunit